MCEQELVHRSQTGDWSAFELLLERHQTVLTRTAYLLTRSRESAQDVVQEALIQVWRDLPSYRPYGSFKSWMLSILANRARGHYRRKHVTIVALESAAHVPDDAEAPEDTVERKEEAHRLRQALELLTSEHREALVLRYYNELSVPEIARALGCREGTVKSRLSRATSRLRQVLSNQEPQIRKGDS